MRYTSTRDESINVRFEEAISSGYAPGGGLFVPLVKDGLSSKIMDLEKWKDIEEYSDLAFEILRMFVDSSEICDEDLKDICSRSYDGFDVSEFIAFVFAFPGEC